MADMKNSQEEFEDKIEEILGKLRTGQRKQRRKKVRISPGDPTFE